MKCISCNTTLSHELVNLGKIPLVNNFSKNNISSDKKYKLCLVVCSKCKLIQVKNKIKPSKLFLNYKHFSSASIDQVNHLKKLSLLFKKNKKYKKILEIGSNDNSLIKNFDNKNYFCCSIDPSVKNNLSKQNVIYKKFFNFKLAQKIYKEHGDFDLIYAINVVPHVENLRSVLKGISLLLKDKGRVVIEGVYLLNNISKGLFDTLYHEHVSNFSFYSLNFALKQFNLKIIDGSLIKTQGGSFRAICVKDSNHAKLLISTRLKKILKKENEININKRELYTKINYKILNKIDNLKVKLDYFFDKIPKNENIIGIGGSARGVVITNVLKINHYLSDVVDDTKAKHGCYFPGSENKIIKWNNKKIKRTKYFIILAWNYKMTLINKLDKIKNGETYYIINLLPEFSINKFNG